MNMFKSIGRMIGNARTLPLYHCRHQGCGLNHRCLPLLLQCMNKFTSPGLDTTELRFNASENDDKRDFVQHSVDDFASLIKNEDDAAIVKEILDNYEYTKYVTYRVPTRIEPHQMKEMMEMKASGQNKSFVRYFNYMFKSETARISGIIRRKQIQEEKNQQRREKFVDRPGLPPGVLFYPDTNQPYYGPWHNTGLVFRNDIQLRKPTEYRRCYSAMWGPRLVFDFSYEYLMERRDLKSLCDQMVWAYGDNYDNIEPFDIHLCNYRKGSNTDEYLKTALGSCKREPVDRPDTFISCHEESYLDIFPKENLIYLSPNAPNPLEKIEHDDIIIVGAIVDRKIRTKETFAKARRENIRTARLPIDENIIWGNAPKVLTLNHIMSILLHAKNTGNWREAFLNHIPKRRLKSVEEIAAEDEYRFKRITHSKKAFFQLNKSYDNRDNQGNISIESIFSDNPKTFRKNK